MEYSRQRKFCHLLKNYIEFYNHYLRCIKEQYVIISENIPTSFTVVDAQYLIILISQFTYIYFLLMHCYKSFKPFI